MKLAKAGEDEDGDIVAVDEYVDVHVDFWEIFQPTEINVMDGAG